jgi:hypothetical protein
MRHGSFSFIRQDCVTIQVGIDSARLVWAVLLFCVWALPAMFLTSSGGWFLAWVALGVFFLPPIFLMARRALVRTHYSFVRSDGRLLLDGELLELARVELRAREFRLLRRYTHYELSLWLMTFGGPLDVPVGTYASLLQASKGAGQLEEFVKTASQKPRVSLS